MTLMIVFDSGFGGLTVFSEVLAARPDADYIYCADNAAFPYGNLSEEQLVSRVLDVMERLIGEYNPQLVVIACNTASTAVLPPLRARYPIPFVGTVPAIKPAAAASKSRMVSVLGTPGTVKREYTSELIAQFGEGCDITLVGSHFLAPLAEQKMRGQPVADEEIEREIAPAFVEKNGKRTDQIVLACTHYPLLLAEFRALSPWEVDFVDPAPAIARRVTSLIGQNESGDLGESRQIVFTGPVPQGDSERRLLEKFGFTGASSLNKPFNG